MKHNTIAYWFDIHMELYFGVFLFGFRPYTLTQVHYSNMVLVVVNTECNIPTVQINTDPVKIDYNITSLACYKLYSGRYDIGSTLTRRRLRPCICRHNDVRNPIIL